MRQAGQASSSDGSVPTTVLSLHQPLASMLAYGLQRVEGRCWSSPHRGKLWIHAASKPPSAEAIAQLEAFYREVHELDGDGRPLVLPPTYPVSCLVGQVEVCDLVTASEFDSWSTLPPGAQLEATSHGRDYFFLCVNHKRLVVPIKMSGQHKLWTLPHATAKALSEGGALVETEQMPTSFVGHRAAAAADRAGRSGASSAGPPVGPPPAAPTAAMKRNARRRGARASEAVDTAAPAAVEPPAAPPAEPAPAEMFAQAVLSSVAPAAPAGSGRADAVDIADIADAARTAPAEPAKPAAPQPSPPPRWAEQQARLVGMGFDEPRVEEMLELCGGDAEAAVALLCS